MNHELFFWMYNLIDKNTWGTTLVYWVAEYMDGLMIAIIVGALIVFFIHDKDWKRRKWVDWLREVVTIALSTSIAFLVAVIVKEIVLIPRPFVIYDMVQPLVTETPYSSFPSGHATVFFALAMSVYLYHKKLGYFFFVCALLIALSRVFAGVHYPVDILVGSLIGILISYLSTIFFLKKR